MLQTLKYLITIRFRKIFAKDDFLAMVLFVLALSILSYFFQIRYAKHVDYLVFFAIQILVVQIDRKDIDFLKLNLNWRLLIFLEYLFLSLPVVVLLLLNGKLVSVLGFLGALFGIMFINNKKKARIIGYPFKMFNPFWTISFRKFKLLWLLPVFGFVLYMGFIYHNPNLQYAVLLVIGVILCIPSSERESLYFIKASTFIGKYYLHQQIKTICYNSMFFLLPMALLFLVLHDFLSALITPFLVLIPLLNLLFKYCFFDRKIVHTIFFGLFIGNLIFGFPLLFIPFLYLKSIKNLKIMQHAYHQYKEQKFWNKKCSGGFES